MKRIVFASCLALFVALCAGGCNRDSKMEGHKFGGGVEEAGQPRVTEAGGGQGSGKTGTSGDGVAEPNPEGTGDPDPASGGDSGNGN